MVDSFSTYEQVLKLFLSVFNDELLNTKYSLPTKEIGIHDSLFTIHHPLSTPTLDV
ncbi:hypothetical protein [Chamaesiphon sp.]|uniref:hypothetical protein n=1 Tax=Chamaesiphon sp. TaxID=2814140 RepID=UPI003594937B